MFRLSISSTEARATAVAQVVQFFAPFRRELLRIGEPLDAMFGIEDDGGRNDVAGQWTTAYFIAAGDQAQVQGGQ
jgi:hypothetical protein